MAPDGPRFLAVPAAPFFPDYAPALPGAVCAELGWTTAEAELYCLVTVPDGDVAAGDGEPPRARWWSTRPTSRARQVVLPDGAHPIRRPLRR